MSICCCTTMYNIIYTMMPRRMSKVLSSIISRSEATFVPGQKIHDHVLLAYEFIRGYSRKGGMPMCMLQMDIQKAYDSVDLKALQAIMVEVGFPKQFIMWVMKAVTTIKYQFNINRVCIKEMIAKRGLRQGDPISPLLFVIIMEHLHRKMKDLRMIKEITGFVACLLPFRYLGIPLTSKKLNNGQCISLMGRIGVRIKHRTVHLLSYSSRIQLINKLFFEPQITGCNA